MPDEKATAAAGQPRNKTPREKALEQVIHDLMHRLAVSQSYLHAVHSTVDPYADVDRGKARIVDALCRKAEQAVFQDHPKYHAWLLDSAELIQQEREGLAVKVSDSQIYFMLKGMILEIVKEQSSG